MSDGSANRKRRRGFGLWMLLSLAVLALLGGLALPVLTGRDYTLPGWITARLEDELAAGMAGGQVEVGRTRFGFGEDMVPVLRLDDVTLSDRTALPVAEFGRIDIAFSPRHALRGELRPRSLALSGALLSLRREPDGRFDLSIDTQEGALGSGGSMADVLDGVDRAFAAPILAGIETVRASDVTFQYEDVRAARFWLAKGGTFEIDQTEDRIEMRLRFELLYGEETPAEAALTVTSHKDSSRAAIAANVTGLPAADFSTQAPALAWLSVIDAPVSGALRTTIDDGGALEGMSGTLDIGAGALQPTAQTRPIGFDEGRAYFTYEPERELIRFDELSVSTEAASLRAEGHAYLRDMVNGWPNTLLGQLRFDRISANPGNLFEKPVQFEGGALDMRLRLDPFTVTVGQFVLYGGGTRLRADGEVSAGARGWQAALDLGVDRITPDRLMRLWPKRLIPKTREWIEQNVIAGTITDAAAAIRLSAGTEPVAALDFNFSDATVRYMKTLPVATGGIGYATIHDRRFSLVVEKGEVEAPAGGVLDVSGTVVTVPDVTLKPADMNVALHVRGAIPAALSLLDEPPFEIMTRAGRPTDLARGRANVTADIDLTLKKPVRLPDVDYRVRGVLSDVHSEEIVEGRVLRAEAMTVRASREGVEISGAGTLGAVPFRAAWTQEFGPGQRGISRVEGAVELSQDFADEFGIALPPGSLSGAASGRIEIDLHRDEAPRFTLRSDLNRLGLSLADIGWSKPRAATGTLRVEGTLGKPADIELLEISAPGLDARGRVALNEDGTLDALRFERVRVGRWLDAPVVLTGRGEGRPPAVEITGGMIDMRPDEFGAGDSGRTSGGPLTARLDRLVVSDGITLTGLSGEFSRQPGFSGRFTAQVNGEAAISGTLVPQRDGTAIRVRSGEAGAVLRAMGIFDIAHGGTMDLILVPRGGEGIYDGQLEITDRVRVRGAPVLADLLGAISVIGLLEQLNGQGLVFSNAEARFRLTPRRLVVSRGSAVGPSLGVSLNGVYDLGTERMDMQGVISPIYVVNGIGALLTRRGEGLFGFNFRMTGPGSDPEVSVNPLSILTPGMFRDIFRRPPPELPE